MTNNQIYEEINKFRTDKLFEVFIFRDLPHTIVGFLLDKTYEPYKLQTEISYNSVQELFDNVLTDSLQRAYIPDEELRKQVIDRIKMEVNPIYSNIFEKITIGLKQMIDAYYDYMMEESQFIQINDMIL